MTSIGIDAISLYTTPYVLHLEDLALARGIDPAKYTVGLGQLAMSVMPPAEDIVTMAAAAARPIINPNNPPSLVLFATESGIDNSKAAGIWVHKLLNLPPSCRVLELKQACYSATGALQLAVPYVQANPTEEVLVIASDNARYGINTPGEPTQGCGACAYIVKTNPRIMAIEQGSGYYTDHVMDFWRPTNLSFALVDGKLSTKIYLNSMEACWNEYFKKTNRSFDSHARICYHLPFSKMAEKAHERLTKALGPKHGIEDTLLYAKQIGNSYTASLYCGLASLLENDEADLAGKRIGLFSYGSGCVAEFFSGIIQPEYQSALRTNEHKELIRTRTRLTTQEYEKFFEECGNQTLGDFSPSVCNTGPFQLSGIQQYIRQYVTHL